MHCLQAALSHSLPLKKAELALDSLSIWGRIKTRNGKDYYVAHSTVEPRVDNGMAVFNTLYFISQDGITWSDLPAVQDATREVAAKLTDMLQGDTTKKFYWPSKPEGEEEEEQDSGGAPHTVHA